MVAAEDFFCGIKELKGFFDSSFSPNILKEKTKTKGVKKKILTARKKKEHKRKKRNTSFFSYD